MIRARSTRNCDGSFTIRRTVREEYESPSSCFSYLDVSVDESGVDVGYVAAWLDLAAGHLSSYEELRDRIGKEMAAEEIDRARDLAERKRAEFARRTK
jgi:hypothetical protein